MKIATIIGAAVAIFIAALIFLLTKKMPPPYDDPANIVINGERMSAKEYVEEFCRGNNDKYRGSSFCERATTEMVRRSTGSENPNNPFHGVTVR